MSNAFSIKSNQNFDVEGLPEVNYDEYNEGPRLKYVEGPRGHRHISMMDS
jgi:hypothetical protein